MFGDKDVSLLRFGGRPQSYASSFQIILGEERHAVVGVLGFVCKIEMLIQAREIVPILLGHMGELVRIKQVTWILSWHGLSRLECSPQSFLTCQAKRRVE
jgi:hypothetical protein